MVSSKESGYQCRRCKGSTLDPWVRKITWKREQATHSSILAWRIPWTEEPGRLQTTESHSVRHDWRDVADTHTHTFGKTELHYQFSHTVMSNSLQPHELQQSRPPCPSPTPRVYPNPRPWSRWCHPIMSSSVISFSSCPFPTSLSFPMSQLFASGGQSTVLSASKSVLSMNIQDWSPLGWTGWISLKSKGLSRVFSNTTVRKHQLFDV